MNAKKNAIRLRKKLFCTDGRSPAIRTNMFINAKKNAEHMMRRIPLYFLFSNMFVLSKLPYVKSNKDNWLDSGRSPKRPKSPI